MKTMLYLASSGITIYKGSWFEINQGLIEAAAVVVAFVVLYAAFSRIQERWKRR